jgi:prevent-host-death family protein
MAKMKTVNIHEAKTHLSGLVEQAAKGEPFVIAKAGKPLVKVTPGHARASVGGGATRSFAKGGSHLAWMTRGTS